MNTPVASTGQGRMPASRCAAWAEAIARYWRALDDGGLVDRAAPMDIVALLSDGGDSLPVLLNAMEARWNFPARWRLVACFPDKAAAAAWASKAGIRPLVASGAVVPAVWRLGEAGPRLVAKDADWQPVNPPVVLLHDILQRVEQRLLAVHYGKLLEADLSKAANPAGDEAEMWQPASPGGPVPALELCRAYVGALNSAPLVMPKAAADAIGQIDQLACGRFLALAAAPGTASMRTLRLLGFEQPLRAYRAERTLPVNFELLQALWQALGARVWQREIGAGWVTQATLGKAFAGQLDLAAISTVLAEQDHGDEQDIARVMASAARTVGEQGILALLRRAHYDKTVFAAACPELHARRLGLPVSDAEAWRQALRAVWGQCVPRPGGDRLYRDVARCAMAIADWAFARQVWQRGIEAHGADPDDLVQLA